MPITVLLFVAQFFFWPSAIDWQTYQGNVAVWGNVIEESSGRPLAGAVVHAISGADVAEATSDSKGHFLFLTLFPGTYRICASKPGYAMDCDSAQSRAEELFAGFEYGATVVLSPTRTI